VSESGLNKTEVRLGLAAFGAIAVVGFATQLLLPALPVPITVGAATGSLLIVFRRWKNTLFRDLHAPVVGLRAELPGIRGEVEETRALVALQEPRFGIPLPWSNWALPPRGLLEVLKTVQELESPTIVDCGSGVSTLHLARAVRELGKGRVIALEQDADWADYIRRMLERHDLASWATLVVAPVEPARSAIGRPRGTRCRPTRSRQASASISSSSMDHEAATASSPGSARCPNSGIASPTMPWSFSTTPVVPTSRRSAVSGANGTP